MKTKEAIKLIERLYFAPHLKFIPKERREISMLIKRGEKLEKMWKKLKLL